MATKTRTRRSTSRKPSAAQTAAAEAKKAERAALIASLEQAAESFEYDEDDTKMARTFESLTSHYSEGNAILIMAQAAQRGRRVRGLQDVGGFGAWVERGRSVKKGEHQSIFIWAKAGTADKRDENAPQAAPEASPAPAEQNSTDAKARSFYRVVGLFHYSQTEDKAKADARRAAAAAE